MKRTRKQDTVPENMALVEIADGRWFPPFASLSEIPHLIDVMEDPSLIPPSRDSFHDPGPDLDCNEEAREACRAWRAQEELDDGWRGLAARTELYPERIGWYLDEITQLTGADTLQVSCGLSVHVVARARQTSGNNTVEIIATTGNTPDEAIETLYQRVYEWFWKLHTSTCAALYQIRLVGIQGESLYVLLRACQHFKTLSHRKEPTMKRNANLHQPIDPVQLTGVKKLLKVEDVADILGVSRVKVYLLLRNDLPSVKIDGARRFQPDKVQAWIEQHSA